MSFVFNFTWTFPPDSCLVLTNIHSQRHNGPRNWLHSLDLSHFIVANLATCWSHASTFASNSSGCIFNQANLVIGSFMIVKMRSQLKKVLIFTWYWMFGCEAPLWSTLVILEFSWPSIPGSWFVDNCGHKIRVSIIWKSTASPRMGAPTNRTSVHNGLW